MANNDAENDSYTPSANVIPPSNIDSKPQKPAAPRARRVKPMVEGINAPVRNPALSMDPVSAPLAKPAAPAVPATLSGSTVVPPKVTLTNSEQELISDPVIPPAFVPPPVKPASFNMPEQKITLPSQGKKSNGSRIVWSILISLLAVSIVLGILFWYNNKSGGTDNQFMGLFPKRQEQPVSAPVQTAPPAAVVNTVVPTTTPAVMPTATTSTSSAPVLPASAPVAAQKVKVTATPTGYLNVRNAPSTGGALVNKVYPGETYVYTKTQSNWYYITLNDGTHGWVIGQYVSVVK